MSRIKDSFLISQGVLAFLLLAFWPFANFINHNRRILRADEVGLTLAIYLGLVFILLIAARLFFKITRIKRTAIWYALMGTGFLLFFSFDGLLMLIHHLIEVFPVLAIGVNHIYGIVCALVLALVLLFVWKTRYGLQIITTFAATAVALPVLGYLYFCLSMAFAADKDGVTTTSAAAFTKRPNVYYFITDEYARQDQILQVTGYDNSPFLAWLRDRGFTVSNSSHTNYPVTFLSLASSLGMAYPYQDGEQVLSRQYAHRIIGGDNPVVRRFRQNGYYYFHAPSVLWNGSRCSGREDACLRPPVGFSNEVVSNIVRMTPLIKIIQKYTMTGESIGTFDRFLGYLQKVKQHTPFFVFFHSLPPHPPYIFRPDCSLKVDTSMRLVDTDTPVGLGETPEGFVDNLKCVNNQMGRALSLIIQEDPEAVIVIHGDHGTPFTVDWHKDPRQWSDKQLRERFSINMVLRFPDKCRALAYDGISPVNVFEAVFACLEDRKPQFKEDVSYGFLYELPGNEDQKIRKLKIP